MDSIKKLIKKLNELLETENPVQEDFDKLILPIKENKTISIKILDFEYYNEDRLKHACKEKIKGVELQNFENVAAWRDKEKKIQKYIDIRKELKVKKSRFFFKEDYLLYLYMGTARNDLVLKYWIAKE